jgi:hypothetical protein
MTAGLPSSRSACSPWRSRYSSACAPSRSTTTSLASWLRSSATRVSSRSRLSSSTSRIGLSMSFSVRGRRICRVPSFVLGGGLGEGRSRSLRPFTVAAGPHVPPWRSTIRFTLARPMPVPSKSSAWCRRWNTPNSLPTYFIWKPTPLSCTSQAVAELVVNGTHRNARRVARARVLDRVGEQVAHRHLQQQRVGPQHRQIGAMCHSMARCGSCRVSSRTSPSTSEAVSTGALLERGAAHAREVEQRVDHLPRVGGRVLHVRQVAVGAR